MRFESEIEKECDREVGKDNRILTTFLRPGLKSVFEKQGELIRRVVLGRMLIPDLPQGTQGGNMERCNFRCSGALAIAFQEMKSEP